MSNTDKLMRQVRSIPVQYRTREDAEEYIIEGYFAVFNSPYVLWGKDTEMIAPTAFEGELEQDVRCLIDHDTRLVLGRTKAGTLKLRTDETGLWGECHINKNDSEAVNAYERVKRGDVDQCSFGFDILDEELEFRDDGSINFKISKVKLYEVSVCTFPAYTETSISARKNDIATAIKRKNQVTTEKVTDIFKKRKENTQWL